MASSDTADALRLQVETYFSDSYLQRNAFFREIAGAAGDNYVPLSILLACGGIKAYATTESEVAAAIAASDVLELSDDGKGVRRKRTAEGSDESLVELADGVDYCALTGESVGLC